MSFYIKVKDEEEEGNIFRINTYYVYSVYEKDANIFPVFFGRYLTRFLTLLKTTSRLEYILEQNLQITRQNDWHLGGDDGESGTATAGTLFGSVFFNGHELFESITATSNIHNENIGESYASIEFKQARPRAGLLEHYKERLQFIEHFVNALFLTMKSSEFTSMLARGREEFVASRFRPSRMQDLSEEDVDKFYIGEEVGDETLEPQFGTLRGVYGGKKRMSKKRITKKRSKARSKTRKL